MIYSFKKVFTVSGELNNFRITYFHPSNYLFPYTTIMKKINLILFFILLLLTFTGCKKALDINSLVPTVPDTPELTSVGDPVGDIASKTIGKNGGSILSPDGSAELIFPANALDHDVDISIQAITNQAPNGVGNAYRFLPEGAKFLRPVTLKFHYTADDLASTIGDLMGIAYQDSLGFWWRLKNFSNDTAGKTISASIRHFTDYTHFDLLIITPRIKTIQINKSIDLSLDMVESGDDQLTNLNGDEIAPLIKTATKKIIWSVNGVAGGNSDFGTVSGNALSATFKAPAKAPKSQNPVAVGAEVNVNATYGGKKFDKTEVFMYIKVIEDAKFNLEITVNEPYQVMTYSDHVTMTVLIKADGTVVISDIANFPPENDPASYTDGGCTLSMVPDNTGEINITSATGTTTGPDPILNLYFTHQGATFPSYKSVCDDGSSDTFPGRSILGIPASLTFTLDNNTDEYENNDGTHVLSKLTRSNE